MIPKTNQMVIKQGHAAHETVAPMVFLKKSSNLSEKLSEKFFQKFLI